MTKAIKMDSAKVGKSWIETICGIKHKKLLSYLRLEFNINFIQRRMSSNASMYRENFLKFKMATIIVWNLRKCQVHGRVILLKMEFQAKCCIWKDTYLHERTLTLNLGLDMHVNVAQHFKMLSDTTNAFYSNLDTHKSQKISHFSHFFSPPVPCPLSRLMLWVSSTK